MTEKITKSTYNDAIFVCALLYAAAQTAFWIDGLIRPSLETGLFGALYAVLSYVVGLVAWCIAIFVPIYFFFLSWIRLRETKYPSILSLLPLGLFVIPLALPMIWFSWMDYAVFLGGLFVVIALCNSDTPSRLQSQAAEPG